MMLDFQGKAEGYGCLVAAEKLRTSHLGGFPLTSPRGSPEGLQSEAAPVRGPAPRRALQLWRRGPVWEVVLTLKEGPLPSLCSPPPPGCVSADPRRLCIVL